MYVCMYVCLSVTGLRLKYTSLRIVSLVPRRLKNRRRAPGIHCLRMRVKIRTFSV